METERKTTKGFIDTLIGNNFPYMEDLWRKFDDWNPSDRVVFKRVPPKDTFINRVIDMQVFFTQITGREPTKVIMGWKQQREMQNELQSLHMIMMPHKGLTGRLVGMDVLFVLEDSRLEVTC